MNFTLSTVLLISSALAHMRILKPDVKFSDMGQQFTFSTLCELAKYPPGAPETMGPAILKAMKEAGFKTVKDLADKCGKPCGLTDKTFLVDPPADGIVVIDDHNINPPHPGPSEIWFDGKKVLYNDGSNYTKENPQHNTKVDFSVCTKDACELRFVMAASHVFPTEIYDNCVMIRGTGKGGSSNSSTAASLPSSSNAASNNAASSNAASLPVVITSLTAISSTTTTSTTSPTPSSNAGHQDGGCGFN